MSPEMKQRSDEAFEQAWNQLWGPQVMSNWISRRWVGKIKEAAKEVWTKAVDWILHWDSSKR